MGGDNKLMGIFILMGCTKNNHGKHSEEHSYYGPAGKR